MKFSDFLARLTRETPNEGGTGGTAGNDTVVATPPDPLITNNGQDTTTTGDDPPDPLISNNENETVTPEPLDREAVIASMGEGYEIENQEQMDAFFDLVESTTDRGELATGLLKMVSEVTQGIESEMTQAWHNTQREWQDEIRSDPVYGGSKLDQSLAISKEVALQYGGSEFLDLLKITGAANHVQMVKFLNKVAEAMPKEAKPVQGSPTTPPKTLADRMFGE